jgi:D-alanyl-D-alanine carboxypeptidase/D-alanyl-D-alanine-endopeptidase (penicillin-binding protein 4)
MTSHRITSAAVFLLGIGHVALAQRAPSIADKLAEIARRPEFVHATFGVAVYDLDAKKQLFGLNAEQLFTPGSTTKLLTMGTALALLGADYRFHTPVYRTGPVTGGTLRGDLVLVASGDPNLSGRSLGDTLGFANEDHSYAGRGDSVSKIIGDPLLVMRELAGQVASKGIKQVDGRVVVDVSLFPQGERELGTGVVISPVIFNDNVVDFLITPGDKAGDSLRVRVSPDLGVFRLVNEATTGAPGSAPAVRRIVSRDSAGVTTVRVTGTYAAGGAPLVMSMSVDDPADYARRALIAALRERGVTVRDTTAVPTPMAVSSGRGGGRGGAVQIEPSTPAPAYADSQRVAEHVSLPLAEEVKVTLKVSQNLHASATPYIVGALVGKTRGRGALQAGFDAEREFLERGGLDLMAAAQGDGAGGAPAAFYSPAFMTQYLAMMATRPDSGVFRRALPILGRDGTLWNIQPQSPAAGKVFAKTGTFSAIDPLYRRTIITGKGLAGYMTTASGKRVSFAIYGNRIPFPPNYPGDAALLVGQALGEIAAAIWATP